MADKFILGFPISEKTADSVMFQDGTNVGIGTITPSTLLSLGNSIDAQKLSLFDGGPTNNNKYGFGIQSGELRQFFPSNASVGMTFGTIDTSDGTTYSERMRILASGGITFNGDTSTSNALDDYEEGTWTPSFSNLTVTGTVSFSGTYTKIGNQVFYTAKILRNSGDITSSASLTQINNLPFTVGGATSVSGGVARLGSLYVEGGMVNRESRTQAWLPAVSATGQTVVMSGTYTV